MLLADRYFPVTDARAPVVLIRTPYGRGSANILVSRLIAERGYQVLVQSLRGTGGSGGTFNGFVMNRDDGLAIIEWMRGRDWFPGAFATWGASYLGYAQWDLASQVIPEWKAAILDVGPSDFYHTFMYPGGVFALGNALGWAQLVSSMFSPDQSIRTRTVSALTAKARLTRAANQLPVSGADRVATGDRIGYFQEWIRHERYDEYWAAMDYRPNASNMPPVVHLAGAWWDFFLPNVLADYAALSRPGRSVRLFISSAAHGRNMALRSYQRDAFATLDRALGNRRPSEPALPVRVRVTGTRHWAELPGWPPATGRPARWYLQPAGILDMRPAPPSPPSRYVYDPANPTPAAGGSVVGWGAGSQDNRTLEAGTDVLTFTSNRLETDLDVIGPVTATLYIRSSLEHTDFHARLCDVDPHGRSLNLCDGIIRLHPGNNLPDPERIRTVHIQLWPTAHRFRSSHRIRLQVSSGAHPRFNRNPGTGEPLATAIELRVAHQEILHDPPHPSTLNLQVVPHPGGAAHYSHDGRHTHLNCVSVQKGQLTAVRRRRVSGEGSRRRRPCPAGPA
ncbi:Cocaine esterase [Arthrobacter sp. Bi26]|nr:Cocaine esterase [Arthrobacter sp. Bi26]